VLDKEQQTSLWHLRWHWEDLYTVACDGKAWSASLAADPAQVLIAGSASGLRTKMQDHYAARKPGMPAAAGPACRT
jgi:hypothetical protein